MNLTKRLTRLLGFTADTAADVFQNCLYIKLSQITKSVTLPAVTEAYLWPSVGAIIVVNKGVVSSEVKNRMK